MIKKISFANNYDNTTLVQPGLSSKKPFHEISLRD